MAIKKTVKKVPAAKKAVTKKHYIVTFDIDGDDPVKVYESLDKAKAFASAIMTGNDNYFDSETKHSYCLEDVDRGSVRVYEAVLIGRPKVEVVFTK